MEADKQSINEMSLQALNAVNRLIWINFYLSTLEEFQQGITTNFSDYIE